MDVSNVKLFAMMKKRMAYHNERQSTIAQNIANANTPKYKPQDVKKPDFKAMANQESGRVQMQVTQPGHIGTSSSGTRFATVKQKETFETTPTGNEVVLEEQMMKLSENQMDYQMTTSVYKKMMDIMRIAVGGGGGR